MKFDDVYFMKIALQQAQIAFDRDEVPIGAVVVYDNQIIAKAHNQTESLKDATAHAEILALTSAMNFLGSKFLEKTTLYVTLEPCLMCLGASFWARVKKIVFGAYDEKFGFWQFEKILQSNNKSLIFNQIEIQGGVLEQEATDLLKEFFRKKRMWKK